MTLFLLHVVGGSSAGTAVPFYNQSAVATVSFAAFTDAESGIARYDVALLSAAGVVVAENASVAPLSVEHLAVTAFTGSLCGNYSWRVGAVNGAGCGQTVVNSSSFIVDPTPPQGTNAIVAAHLVRGRRCVLLTTLCLLPCVVVSRCVVVSPRVAAMAAVGADRPRNDVLQRPERRVRHVERLHGAVLLHRAGVYVIHTSCAREYGCRDIFFQL